MKRAQFLSLVGVSLAIGLIAISPARAQQQPLPVQPAPSSTQNSSTTQAPTNAQQRADLVRKRAEWFQKQRAYPFAHIPSGALQQAIDQRNAMIQQKPSGRVLAAPPLINFPGNGLWQLTGPQPTNVPSFPGLETVGFPTVSGRVTALAVDTTDTTADGGGQTQLSSRRKKLLIPLEFAGQRVSFGDKRRIFRLHLGKITGSLAKFLLVLRLGRVQFCKFPLCSIHGRCERRGLAIARN